MTRIESNFEGRKLFAFCIQHDEILEEEDQFDVDHADAVNKKREEILRYSTPSTLDAFLSTAIYTPMLIYTS